DVRTVLPAQASAAQQTLMRQGYAFVDQTSPAASTLNTYFGDPTHDPRVLGRTMQRTVQVTSVIPMAGTAGTTGADTWRLRWTELESPLQPGVLTHTT